VSKQLDAVIARLEGVRRNGSQWKALCPAHADKNPSLSVSEKNGKILLNCLAGCPTEKVLDAAGLGWKDLFTESAPHPRIVAEYPYTDEHGTLLYQNVRFDPKDFSQRRPNDRHGWTWKLGNVRRVLYRLPQVLAASVVVIVEGEKDADTGNTLGLAATTSGASGTWREEFSEMLRGKRVTIIADADAPGRKHAQQVARSLFGRAESLKLLELPHAKDLSEWVEQGGTRGALLDLVQNAPEWKPQSVEGGTVLDKVFAYVRRFVSLSESQARIAALWVVHTHVFSTADATPYLAITSAEKQSGKTRLLEVFETLVANPWLTGRVTAAVLIRKIDAERPTLLLDESDAAFGSDKEYAEGLRAVLNTGHRDGGKASCCVGQGANITFRDFSTFCPKAIAGIGKLPDTVADRAIPIRLKRAAPGEGVQRFRRHDIESEVGNLRQQIEAWCASIGEKLRDARPQLPEKLTDRQQDGAEPLLAIADAADGDWPKFARRALVELCTEAQASDDSIGKQLLADIRQIFEKAGVDRLPSSELVGELVEIETSPWGEWSHGKPLTAPRLARLLKPFEVFPECIRVGDKTPRGYLAEQFRDAFRRYLRAESHASLSCPAPESATPQHAATDAGFSDFSECNTETDVAAQKCEKANKHTACCTVALSNSPTGVEGRGIEEEL
jgi:hypothetical protein